MTERFAANIARGRGFAWSDDGGARGHEFHRVPEGHHHATLARDVTLGRHGILFGFSHDELGFRFALYRILARKTARAEAFANNTYT